MVHTCTMAPLDLPVAYNISAGQNSSPTRGDDIPLVDFGQVWFSF